MKEQIISNLDDIEHILDYIWDRPLDRHQVNEAIMEIGEYIKKIKEVVNEG